MDAWGIIMTASTMFGMLALLIVALTTDDGLASTETQLVTEAVPTASELKEAA